MVYTHPLLNAYRMALSGKHSPKKNTERSHPSQSCVCALCVCVVVGRVQMSVCVLSAAVAIHQTH